MNKETTIYLFRMLPLTKVNPKADLCQSDFKIYSTFKSEKRRAEFFNSRFLLRLILKEIYGKENIQIGMSKNGKPQIRNLRFNISHSENVLVLAINQKVELGIDVEKSRPQRHFLSIAEQYFSRQEFESIKEAKNPKQKQKRFKSLWSLKESYIKAFDGVLNKKTIQIYFQLSQNRVENAPTKKQLTFFYYPKWNISLCLKGLLQSSNPKFVLVRINKNKGLMAKQVDPKCIKMNWPNK